MVVHTHWHDRVWMGHAAAKRQNTLRLVGMNMNTPQCTNVLADVYNNFDIVRRIENVWLVMIENRWHLPGKFGWKKTINSFELPKNSNKCVVFKNDCKLFEKSNEIREHSILAVFIVVECDRATHNFN